MDEGDKEDKAEVPTSNSLDDDEFFEAEEGESNEVSDAYPQLSV